MDGMIVSILSDLTVKTTSAIDIYKAEFKSDNKPSYYLPAISFNKNPLLITLIIYVYKNNSDIFISAKIQLREQTGRIEFFTNRLRGDHLIHENAWYPIYSEDFEQLMKIFSDCGIEDIENISLRSYLKILRIRDAGLDIKFRDADAITPKQQSKTFPLQGFNAKLYDYQSLGYKWLSKISAENFGCILADEMGLGKTIQIIALIYSSYKTEDAPSLVICPASLLENWRREFLRFAPEIRTQIHNGITRTGFPDLLKASNVIITSYDTAVRDFSLLDTILWNYIICDEAQALKNPIAKRTRYIKRLNRRVIIAVTGTPFENRLTDIWSLIDLVASNLLGGLESFKTTFPDTIQSAEKLEPIISPLILRRKVEDVAKDLPERIDISVPIIMDEKAAGYYEVYRNDILKKYGKKASLVNLQLLRQFCCDPELAFKDGINYDEINTKFQRLLEIITEVYKNGAKAIIFTSFHDSSHKIIRSIKHYFKCYVDFIDGRVSISDRQPIIDEFSNVPGAAFLLLNPKAAGTGLNITAANYVIHYNLEWNPAVEDQANARAFRRGQNKPVFIYKLYYVQTVEEYIINRGDQKRKLSKKSIIGINGESASIVEIMKALSYSPQNEKQDDSKNFIS